MEIKNTIEIDVKDFVNKYNKFSTTTAKESYLKTAVKFVPGGIIDLGECEVAQNTLGSNVQNIAETSRYFKQKILENNNMKQFAS